METPSAADPAPSRLEYTKGYFALSIMVSAMILGALGMVLILGGAHNASQSERLQEVVSGAADLERASSAFTLDTGDLNSDQEIRSSLEQVDGGKLEASRTEDGVTIRAENRDGLTIEIDLGRDGEPRRVSCSAGWPGDCPSLDSFAP